MRVIVILLAALLASCAGSPDARRNAALPVEGTWVRESVEVPGVTEGMVLAADGQLGFFGMRTRSGVTWRRDGADLVLSSMTTEQPYVAETRLVVEGAGSQHLLLGPAGHPLAGQWNRNPEAAARVTGTVNVSRSVTVPPDLVLDVTLQDVSRADAPARTLARYSVPLGDRKLPVKYTLYYRATHVDPRATYAVAARALAAGKLYYVTTQRYEVLTRDRPAQADLVMDPAGMAQPRAQSPVGHEVIVGQERAFAAASVKQGTRAAFLAFLAEDSIVLQPGPVWGRAAYEAAPASDDTLDWRPAQAMLSADGNFGVATGRWLLTPQGEAARVEGRYLTAWRKRDGRWQVVFDGGYGRKLEGSLTLDDVKAQALPGACIAGASPAAGEIETLDTGLGGGAEPWPARLTALAHPALTLYHPRDPEPVSGAERLTAALAAASEEHDYRPMGAYAAGSGDLTLSYGLVAPVAGDGKAAATQAYAHVWCRTETGWRLLVELRSRLPPPQ